MAHQDTCQPCKVLLTSVDSWERPLNVFLDEVRDHKPALVSADVRDPVTGAASVGVFAALSLFGGITIAYKGDAVTSISYAALGWTPPLIWLAAIAAGAAIVFGFITARRHGYQVSFVQHGMVATAGAFALFFMGYGAYNLWTVASNHQSVQSAENTALTIVAARIGNGSRRSDAIKVPAFTKTLVGTVVAEPQETAGRCGSELWRQGSADALPTFTGITGQGQVKSTDQEKRKKPSKHRLCGLHRASAGRQGDGEDINKDDRSDRIARAMVADKSQTNLSSPWSLRMQKEASRVLLVEELKEQASQCSAPLGR